MSLFMVQLALEPRHLYAWAETSRLSSSDPGYLIHVAMRSVFGQAAPQPFVVMDSKGARALNVLGYTTFSRDLLLDQRARLAPPLLADAVPPDVIHAKTMPEDWPSGRRFGFRVRCCPVVRRPNEKGRATEHDAFLSECQRHPGEPVDRAEVYAGWLARELGRQGAADVEQGALRSFRLFQPVRRRGSGRPARLGGRRPDATLEGMLSVGNGDAFKALLCRGLGRHRAFGFGMLLLQPVGPRR